MPPKSKSVGSRKERAKDRDRKAEQAVILSQEKAKLQAEVRAKKLIQTFKDKIRAFPIECRVQWAANAYTAPGNQLTQKDIADQHVIGLTSLKNAIDALQQQEKQKGLDAALLSLQRLQASTTNSGRDSRGGAAAAAGGGNPGELRFPDDVMVAPALFNLDNEAENEAYLTYLKKREDQAKALALQAQALKDLKKSLPPISKQKREVRNKIGSDVT
jgi:hypothetical protein